MDLDRSFAEFVSARWPMLYRLGDLLAGDRADQLLRAALVRAYVEWADLAGTPAPEQRVTALLAGLAADGPTTGTEGLEALPAARRVSVVLRCYELLGDGEVARILGRHAQDVAAELAAGLDGLGRSATEVGEELVRRAEAVVVPAAPVEELLARGREARRGRRRRALAWTAAALALLLSGFAVATVVQSHGSGRRAAATSVPVPDTLSALPKGAGPRVPYAAGRVLFLDGGRRGVTLDEAPVSLVTAGTWAYLSYPSGRIVRVSTAQPLDVQVVAERSQGAVVTDPAGRFVAWVEAGTGRARVVLRPVAVADNSADLRETLAGSPACCDTRYTANGITGDGLVVVSVDSSELAWAWKPFQGGDVRIDGLGTGSVDQVTATEVVAAYSVHYAVGRLSTDGTVLVEDEVTARRADFADPLGKRVLFSDVAGEVHVRERRPLDRTRSLHDVRLGLPVLPEAFRSAHWEDAEHVLLDVADASMPRGAIVRCAVTTGSCQLAVGLDTSHLLAR